MKPACVWTCIWSVFWSESYSSKQARLAKVSMHHRVSVQGLRTFRTLLDLKSPTGGLISPVLSPPEKLLLSSLSSSLSYFLWLPSPFSNEILTVHSAWDSWAEGFASHAPKDNTSRELDVHGMTDGPTEGHWESIWRGLKAIGQMGQRRPIMATSHRLAHSTYSSYNSNHALMKQQSSFPEDLMQTSSWSMAFRIFILWHPYFYFIFQVIQILLENLSF